RDAGRRAPNAARVARVGRADRGDPAGVPRAPAWPAAPRARHRAHVPRPLRHRLVAASAAGRGPSTVLDRSRALGSEGECMRSLPAMIAMVAGSILVGVGPAGAGTV